jgi:hypothetical protein
LALLLSRSGYVQERLPPSERVVLRDLPWPDAPGVGIYELQSLELRPVIEPEVPAEMPRIMLSGDFSEVAGEAIQEFLADIAGLVTPPGAGSVAILVDDVVRELSRQSYDDQFRGVGRAIDANRIGEGRVPISLHDMENVAAILLYVGKAFLLMRIKRSHAARLPLRSRAG